MRSFHKAPSSVYDLRPSLGLQGLFATRDPVAGHLDIGGSLPDKLAVDLHTFLRMDDVVVDNALHSKLIAFWQNPYGTPRRGL